MSLIAAARRRCVGHACALRLPDQRHPRARAQRPTRVERLKLVILALLRSLTAGARLGRSAGGRWSTGLAAPALCAAPAWRSRWSACPCRRSVGSFRPHARRDRRAPRGDRPGPGRRGRALIGDGPARLAAPAAGQRVVPAPQESSGDVGAPGPPRRRSTASASSTSATSTSPLPTTAGSSRPWLDEAAAWHADLVVFTGDLVDHDAALDWIVPVLSPAPGPAAAVRDPGQPRLRSTTPAGSAGVLGAAGIHRPGRALGDRSRSSGATLRPGRDVVPLGTAPRLRTRSREADFRLLLSHTPDLLYRAAAAGGRPDALGPQPRRPGPPARSSARSSCPASTPAGSTAASSGPAGPCCTSARGSPASTRSATAACPRSRGSC